MIYDKSFISPICQDEEDIEEEKPESTEEEPDEEIE